jgi:hypothetical protein
MERGHVIDLAMMGNRRSATEPQRRGECPKNGSFSALGSVPPWLCGNISLVMAETTIKAMERNRQD